MSEAPVPDANTLATLHGQIARLYARIWELEQELRRLSHANAALSVTQYGADAASLADRATEALQATLERTDNSRDHAGETDRVVVFEDDGQIEP